MIDGNLLLSQRAMKQARDERTGGGERTKEVRYLEMMVRIRVGLRVPWKSD
jgi:hypothetical protein